jgi:hypothetical protein
LRVLVEHLPRTSSFSRSLHGEAAEWTIGDHLLAAVVDQLAVANWIAVTVNSGEDADPLPYPEPIQRPEDPDRATETPSEPEVALVTPLEIRRFLETM